MKILQKIVTLMSAAALVLPLTLWSGAVLSQTNTAAQTPPRIDD